MSGQRRLHREQKSAQRRGRLFFWMLGFVALGVAITLLFAYFGWTPAEMFAP
jgi:hypothetical protein